MNKFFEAAASVAECAVIAWFISAFFGFKNEKPKWLKALKIGIFFAALCVNNLLIGSSETFAMLSIALLILTVFVYSAVFLKGEPAGKVFLSFFTPMIILIMNELVISSVCIIAKCPFYEAEDPSGKYRLLVLALSKLLFFAVCAVMIHFKRNNDYPLSRLQWTIQILCFAAAFSAVSTLWGILRQYSEIREKFILVYLMLAAINILLYIMQIEMRRDAAEKEKLKLSEVTAAAQQKFVEEARRHYAEISTLRHDMRHYLTTAAELIADGNAPQAREYLEELVKEKIEPLGGGANTGSVIVDAVINNALSVCRRNDIETKFLIDSRFDGIGETDISVLLSNALDNAVNGCAGVEAPRVELVIGARMAFTYIIVRNTIPISVLENDPELATTGADKEHHGYGVGSMRHIAEKYGGSIEFKESGGMFITEIWLKNNDADRGG